MERSRGFSVRSGRIILLGDGTEVITDQNDEELFDQTEEDEDEDLTNQVQHESSTRNDRQATPGPQEKQENVSGTSAQISESPASTDAEKEKSAS